MIINNILVVSPMYKELEAIIAKEGLQKNFRYLPENGLSQDDLNWADCLVSFHLNAEYDYSHIQWIHSLGAGVDRFLYKKAWKEDVLLTRTICSFGQRIAEYCLSYLLKDLQFHGQFQEFKRQKEWHPMIPRLLNKQKVMIYGTGEIGQTIAKVFSGLGVEVLGVSLNGQNKDSFKEVMTVDTHYSRLAEMNYLINTLPLTEQTADLLNWNIFSNLRGAGFMNVGRGASVNEEALLMALKYHFIRFAVLDVFSQEPLPNEHPFWNHPNIHITPHISAVTTAHEGATCFLDTLKNIEENMPLKNKVDIKKGY
jgi:phosphoglycerate dehydrogenase-like enzyme